MFTTGEIFGTVGVAILLLAFIMTLIKRWKPENLYYILSNIIGAALACISSILIDFMPFIILEATWTVVSIMVLVKYIKSHRSVK